MILRILTEKKDVRISVQAHHSFVDGIHVGKFEERLQAHLNGKI
jgi:chloramphenicol O-acetyltransferase